MALDHRLLHVFADYAPLIRPVLLDEVHEPVVLILAPIGLLLLVVTLHLLLLVFGSGVLHADFKHFTNTYLVERAVDVGDL